MSSTADTSFALDPPDWDRFRDVSSDALGHMIDFLQTIREREVWRAPSESAREHFRQPLPRRPGDLAAAVEEFRTFVEPYANGNLHPLFMGWVHGAGTPVGMVAEMLAAGLNANCGGRNHIAIEVERQIVRWAAEMLDFPPDASGLFVTGSSAANLLAVLVARSRALGDAGRSAGLRQAGGQLVGYTSSEAHGCVVRAFEIAGIGSDFLRRVPVDGRGAMRIDLLLRQLEADRQAGLRPFMVIGTAGTVNTGAIDDLGRLAEACRAAGLWLHVDGAFGALCALSPRLKPLLAGIERADSVAFDFHKWAHVPYDAGFLLVRDAEAHRRTFGSPAAYLNRAPAGLAAGELWPCDLGPDLSRGFRALKTWFTLRVFGADRIGASIEHTCDIAAYLQAKLRASGLFEVHAPVTLNIVCFGLHTPLADAQNKAIVVDLHERGVAAPSTTVLDGRTVIRAAIVNHRTTEQDIDAFIEELQSSALRVTLAMMKRAVADAAAASAAPSESQARAPAPSAP